MMTKKVEYVNDPKRINTIDTRTECYVPWLQTT